MTNERSGRKICFVVGPIGTEGSPTRLEADWLLEGIIIPVFAARSDFIVLRADKVSEPGMIDSQIINYLLDAELVIADLTALNANAFYEIGIRHMVQKPIIHMFPPDLELPFDVKPYRSIPFARVSPSDLHAAQKALDAQVSAVLADGYQVENPVTRARGKVELQEHATPETRLVMDQLEDLSLRLMTIERANARSDYDRIYATPEAFRFGDAAGKADSVVIISPRPGQLFNDRVRNKIMATIVEYVGNNAMFIPTNGAQVAVRLRRELTDDIREEMMLSIQNIGVVGEVWIDHLAPNKVIAG